MLKITLKSHLTNILLLGIPAKVIKISQGKTLCTQTIFLFQEAIL